MYINFVAHYRENEKFSYCGGALYAISGKIPAKYHKKSALEFADLNDDFSNNKIVQLNKGFKSIHEEYVIVFLSSACKRSERFVDVIPREKLEDLASYFSEDTECVFVCFVGKDLSMPEVTI